MEKQAKLLLVDANVLIDYLKSDFSVLGLVGRYINEVHVLTTIIEEVNGLSETDCERHGLKVIEPGLKQLVKAASRRGQLSFCDHLCLIVASDEDFICITNDKALRRACLDEGVGIMWGLELMIALVRATVIPSVDAIRIAEMIHNDNPLHISRKLVSEFAKKLAGIEKGSGR